MKSLKKYLLAALLAATSITAAAVDTVVIKRTPDYMFSTASGRSLGLMFFDTLDEAWAEVQAKYETYNGPFIRYSISNLRGEPSTISINGYPFSYMWDVQRTFTDTGEKWRYDM